MSWENYSIKLIGKDLLNITYTTITIIILFIKIVPPTYLYNLVISNNQYR